MKKNLLFVLAVAAALTSCKTSDSSYKKAYEKAKAQETAVQPQQQQVVEVAPIRQQTTTVQDNSDLRSERLNTLNGGTLKTFNVVCGSFKSLDNANNLRNTLVNKGYSAQVAQNPETGMYRVIASSFDDRNSAVNSRNALRATYPDAWILYRTY